MAILRYKSPKQIISYDYIRIILEILFLIIINIGLYYICQTLHWTFWLFKGLLILSILYICVLIFRPWVLYYARAYEVHQNDVIVLKSFFFKKRAVIKYDRIQMIKKESGPLLRGFGLYKLSLVTAGHELTLPRMDAKHAEKLEAVILRHLEEVDADV